MYDNIGKKVQGLAKALAIIGSILYVIFAIILIAIDESLILLGFLFMIIGPLVCCISSWTLYGFGEIIETVNKVAHYNYHILNKLTLVMQKSQQQSQEKYRPDPQKEQRLREIETLFAQGLLTEEEFQNAKARVMQ